MFYHLLSFCYGPRTRKGNVFSHVCLSAECSYPIELGSVVRKAEGSGGKEALPLRWYNQEGPVRKEGLPDQSHVWHPSLTLPLSPLTWETRGRGRFCLVSTKDCLVSVAVNKLYYNKDQVKCTSPERGTNPLSIATRERSWTWKLCALILLFMQWPLYGSRGSGEPGVHSLEPSMRYRSASTFDPDKPHSVLLIRVQSAWYFRMILQRNILSSERMCDFRFLAAGKLHICVQTRFIYCCAVDTHSGEINLWLLILF